MADEGKNIRSVIKNATLGISKVGEGIEKMKGIAGKGDTIATKDEINQSKAQPETPKMGLGPKLGVQGPVSLDGLKQKLSTDAGKSEVLSQIKKSSQGQDATNGVSVSQQPQITNPFENTTNQPIEDIKVEQFNNENFKLKRPEKLNVSEGVKPIDTRLRELPKDKSKRISKGIENLYIDAYNKSVDGGTLTIEDVLGNSNYQQQFNGVDEKALTDMINDANYLAQGEYDTSNVISIMEKYKDLGLQIDLEELPPQTKAQYIKAMLEESDGGLGEAIDYISPLNLIGEGVEWVAGTNPRDYNQKMQQWAEEGKHDFLTEEELNYMIENQVKALDEEYKQYYHHQMEEMFDDRRIGVQFYKDVFDLMKKNKGMTEDEAVNRMMKEGTYNGVAYEKFKHTTTDQGRFWDDKKMEKEYNKKLDEIKSKAKEAHGDTTANWWKNLGLDATLVVGQGLDLTRNIGSTAEGLFSLGKGAIYKSVEGYADLLDTAVATAETVFDKDKEWEGIQYRTDDLFERIAKSEGYENYDSLVQKMEQASEGDSSLGVATWLLKQGKEDLGTANAFGDYLTAAYGDWDKVEQTAKENPVQMASDIISIVQLGTLGASKMGLIDEAKANQIIKMAGYGDMYEQTLKWGNKLQFGPVLKGEMKTLKAGAKVIGAPLKFGKNMIEVFVNKLSGISKEERDFIKQNPEKVEEFLNGDKNSQTLLDKIVERFDGLGLEKKLEGEEYEKIKNSNTPVKIEEILNKMSETLKKGGLELTNDGIKVNKNYTPALNRKFEEMGEFIDELRKLGNSATAENVWWTRRQLDTLAKWEGQPAGLEADAINLIRDIRGILDKELKRQVSGFEELDKSYKETIGEIKELKQDWFNKDGTLRDSAYSKIRNLTNKGANQPKLARLERLLPGITEELKGLAVAETVERAGKQMVGQYANQIFGVGGGITAITSLLSGGLSAGPIILGVLGATLATPKNLVKLLKYQGKISKGFDRIIEKIKNGIGLTPGETQEFTKYINDNKENLKKDAEYLYRKGLITEEEYKNALKNKEKEVKKTGNMNEKPYNSENNLNSNQKKDGVIKESKNDTGKGEKNLGGLAKKEKSVEQGGIGQKTSGQARNDGGRVSQKDGGYLEMNTDGAKVVENLEKIKASNPDGFKMDIHGVEDYGNGKRKTFQSKDGMSSVTVKEDGDITSLVSKPGLKRGKELVLTAIKNGGDKLDCYEEYLPTMYQNAGFEPVARVKFNPEYAPADWKGKGQDIIVMMRRNNDSVEKVAENWGNYEKIDLDDLPVMEYDEALAYRDSLLAERKMREGEEKGVKNGLEVKEKEEKDYITAVDKARAKLGDKEKALKGKEGEKIIEDIKKKAKNIGFVTEIEKGLKDENGGKVLGLADVKNKIIKLSKNLTDTTAQHELFHAVMSVVDGKTRKYVIDEAKKILKDRGISDVNAEEWLAESFGVYAKRKQVNLGVFDKVKWGDGKIRAVVGDLFQRVYEWLQNYNGDRKTINKLFDEILDDKVKIGENGGVDLSYLLEGKDLEGKGLKGKDGLMYKKDLSNKDSSGRSLSDGQVEYFRNSKARDKNGNLIRVYHGTSGKFNVFDENKVDKKGNYFGAGFYFTDDVESARDYGGLVKEGYLNIEKIFDMSKYYTEAEYNGLLKELGLSKDELPAYKTKDGEYHLVSGYERDTFRRQGDNSYNFDGGRLTEALKKAGYDGIMGEIGDEREFVVFNSNQFKNVDNLNPTKSEDIRYKKVIENNREDMKKDLIERAKSGFYDRLKGEQDEFLQDVADATGGYAVKAPLKYGSKGEPEFGIKGKKGERILDKGMHKQGGIRDVNDIARGTIRVDTIGDIYKVVDYIKENYKNVSDFDDKYAKPTPMGYVDYSLLFEGSEGGKAETQINATPMIVAKEKMKDALNYGISEEEYMDIVKKSGTKGGGLGHTFYDEQRGIITKLAKGGLSKNEIRFLKGRVKTLSRDSRNYYDAYMKLLKK